MQPITTEELDYVIEHHILGDAVDQDALQREMDAIQKSLEDSSTATSAMQAAILHIQQKGPGHVSCGVQQSVAAFFLVAMKIMERRHNAAPEIDELNRWLSLESEEKPNG